MRTARTRGMRQETPKSAKQPFIWKNWLLIWGKNKTNKQKANLKCAAQGGNDAHRIHRWRDDGDTRRRRRFVYHSSVNPRRSRRQRDGGTDGVRGREGKGAVGSRGDGKVSELPCLLRRRSRKTTEFSSVAADVMVVQFLFWPPEDGATKADGRISGGDVPGSQRDTDTHTHRRTLSVLHKPQPRPMKVFTAAAWKEDSAPCVCHS